MCCTFWTCLLLIPRILRSSSSTNSKPNRSASLESDLLLGRIVLAFRFASSGIIKCSIDDDEDNDDDEFCELLMLHSSTSTIQKLSSEMAKERPFGEAGGDHVFRTLDVPAGSSCRGVGDSGGLDRGLRVLLREIWPSLALVELVAAMVFDWVDLALTLRVTVFYRFCFSCETP